MLSPKFQEPVPENLNSRGKRFWKWRRRRNEFTGAYSEREREREKYYLANFDKVQQMITAGAVVNYVIIQATEIFYLEMEATFNYRNTKHTH